MGLQVFGLAASPVIDDLSTCVLRRVLGRINAGGFPGHLWSLRELPFGRLARQELSGADLAGVLGRIDEARLLVISTSLPGDRYDGLLELFVDVLPHGLLMDKLILPVGTCGDPGATAFDATLGAVLADLGATDVLPGLYLEEAQLQRRGGSVRFDAAAAARVERSVVDVTARLRRGQVGEAMRPSGVLWPSIEPPWDQAYWLGAARQAG